MKSYITSWAKELVLLRLPQSDYHVEVDGDIGWKTKESVSATDTLCSNANECLPSGSLKFFKLMLLKMKCIIL